MDTTLVLCHVCSSVPTCRATVEATVEVPLRARYPTPRGAATTGTAQNGRRFTIPDPAALLRCGDNTWRAAKARPRVTEH